MTSPFIRSTTTRLAAGAAAGALAVSVLTGCVLVPSGPTVSDEQSVTESITGLVLETSADVEIVLGDEPGLELTGPRAALDRLTVESSGDTLVIGSRGAGFALRDVRATLTVVALESVAIRGAGDVEADFTGADEVSIEIEGAGDIEARGIDAASVTARISGAGDITLDGRAESGSYRIEGAGNIDGSALELVDGVVEISGAGSISVFATGTLRQSLDGIGDVKVTGEPRIVG